jgi:hypothetical protein
MGAVFGYRYGTPKAPVKDALKEAATSCSTSTGRARSSSSRIWARIWSRSSSCRRRWPSSSAGCASAAPTARRSSPTACARGGEISHWAEYDYVLVNETWTNASPRSGRSSPPSASSAPPGRPGHLRPRPGRPGALAEQLQEARRGEEVAAAVLQRRSASASAPHCSSCQRSSTLTASHACSGVIAFSSTASAATSEPPIVTSGDRPASRNGSSAATACASRSTVAGGCGRG